TDVNRQPIPPGPADPNRGARARTQPPGSPGFFAGNGKFLTPKLGGPGNEPPFFHHGQYTTLRQSVLAHAGEADALGAGGLAFKALSAHDQDSLIEFLKTLRVLPPGTKQLVVDPDAHPHHSPPHPSPRRPPAPTPLR